MGFTPTQVDECSLWQFGQAVEGKMKEGKGSDSAPSDSEFKAAVEHFEKTGKGPTNAKVSAALKHHIKENDQSE